MTEILQIYRCGICGNVVQVLSEGADALVCCGEAMELLEIQHDTNELGEKHSPKLEERDGRRFVSPSEIMPTSENILLSSSPL